MKKEERGLTLIELIIAVALIGIGIIVASGAFKGIHQAIQGSKTRTLASNIAQEKMQILMQKSYYEVLVTTSPAFLTIGSVLIPYDSSVFIPETLVEGGGNYTRYTDIQVVQENNGVIQVLPPLTPDTGMRQITITVVWNSYYGQKYLTIQNVLNNPNTVMASTWLKGVVLDSTTLNPIQGAVVDAAENVGWRDTTTSSGTYSINLVPGSFNFQASAAGYYSSIQPITVAFNNVTNYTFYLQAIATGTVQGTAWLDNNLVISQVVGSTITAGFRQAFVELYNPTTAYINIAAGNVPSILLKWQKRGDASPTTWNLDYTLANSTVPPHGYYLIANTTTIIMGGISRTADAVFDPSVPNYPYPIIIASDLGADAASLGLSTPSGAWIDQLGWTHNGILPANYPPFYEVTPILNFGPGLVDGEQFVRRCSTSGVSSPPIGRGYNDVNNSWDFVPFNPALSLFPPRNSGDIELPISGTPATGAHVSITDGLSGTSTTTVTGGPPYAQFTVPGVATGTWTVFIDSNTASAEIDTVTVVANSITSIPNAVLSQSGILGIINGHVTDDLGVAISGGITVTAGIYSTTTGLSGSYSLRVASGTYNVTANPNNLNTSYSSQVQSNITIAIGDVTQDLNFQLSKTGKILGWITRDGVNPLPGVDVVALDAFGSAHDTEASGNNGLFTLINLTTGTYTVQPVLDPKETSAPLFSTVTVTAGNTVMAGTFTITGAMGQVQGNVTASGQPIKSGVLIVVSTGVLALPLPAISSNTLSSGAIYSDSSKEDGTYSVDVRGSTSSVYNVSGFYMYLNNQTPVISTATRTNVTVTAGQTTSGVNFAW